MVREGRSFGWWRGNRSARVHAARTKAADARAPHRLAVSAAAVLVLSLALALSAASVSAAALGPFVQQGSKIAKREGSGGSLGGTASSEGFGDDVAVSANGDTAVVGTGFTQGAVGGIVYTRSGSTWSQQAALRYTGQTRGLNFPSAGSAVGTSVAISADGNIILLGGPGNDFRIGAVWVFTRSGSTWTQQEVLKPSGYEQTCAPGNKVGSCPEATVFARFGDSVAISGNANVVLIGGPEDEHNTGAAWVFKRSGGVYVQQGAKLTVSGGAAGAHFGAVVALSSNGQNALIAAPDAAGGIGAVWDFERAGHSFEQVGGSLPNDDETPDEFVFNRPPAPGSHFGRSLALSAEGETAVIGAAESAQILRQRRTGWVKQASLTPGESVGAAEFGLSVAISGDGETALVGGPEEDDRAGAAWAFTRSGRSWSQLGSKLLGGEEQSAGIFSGNKGGAFGKSVALARDGRTAVIGGPADDNNTGALWPFVREHVHP